jgi:type IV pilus assembly protein PilE
MARTRSSGFTMLEILVALVVVAILAAVAIPSYRAYVIRAQRATAKVALEQAAQYLERNFTTYGCYNFQAQADCASQAGTTALNSLPTSLASAPSSGAASYAIAIAAPPAGTVAGQAFSLTATPTATFTDPDCGSLSLDNTGQTGINVSGTWDYTSTQALTCWQR